MTKLLAEEYQTVVRHRVAATYLGILLCMSCTAPPNPADKTVVDFGSDTVELAVDAAEVKAIITSSGSVLVEAIVDGQGPFLFLLDTGSGSNSVTSRVANLIPDDIVGSESVQQSVIAPTSVLPLAKLKSLKVGPVVWNDLMVHVLESGLSLDGRPVDGILGLQPFRAVLLTIDYPNAVLRVEVGELSPADGCSIFPLDYRGPYKQPVVGVDVQGRHVDLMIDTAISVIAILPDEFSDLSFVEAPTTTRVQYLTYGYDALSGCLPSGSIKLGCIEFGEQCVLVGYDRTLGSGALVGRKVTFDQIMNRVRIAD